MSRIAKPTPERRAPARPPRRGLRDADASRAAILAAALAEFSEHGHSGARVDRIAARAGVSKPLIYDYFGDKDAIYAAALREAYVQIRTAEEALHLENLSPPDAIRALTRFTMAHFWDRPWFITMLNTENLRGGTTIREIGDAREIQSVLLGKLSNLLLRGAAEGAFRPGVDPARLYVMIASLCWFPVSNRHTLSVVFDLPVDRETLLAHADDAAGMVLAWLEPRP